MKSRFMKLNVLKSMQRRRKSLSLGESSSSTIAYDYLVVGVGAQSQTFGIKGVEEYGCFFKEVWNPQEIRKKLMDSIESATLKNCYKSE
ncbi:hypothetical protein RO3G_10878 [Rhizopus delemar RA 99-880]|uniref:NADH:ubiquinone reductase (non-electrogenic) n=1 Tax=Rhizopus delemar (strain RA 99-880 / ATCC MYA-4621 / FGSC 9543 / NRRL 43880) TaxID=246409 RepID=I1CCI7_RHIO9|nr:hypothetical protein RO3G_10878 [Rhizopus delemar RA 99-880]|eukprot:EIE86167.1 hypothetical protein RO3G_10878 [Rhizopus delemar RA 99-880]